MCYEDHWADNDPPKQYKKYNVTVKLAGGSGSIQIRVDARDVHEARATAMHYIVYNIRLESVFSD